MGKRPKPNSTKKKKPFSKVLEELDCKKCPTCPKKFKNQSSLDKHISTKACINPCGLCNKNFTCLASRAHHLENCIKEYMVRRTMETNISGAPVLSEKASGADIKIENNNNLVDIEKQHLDVKPWDNVSQQVYQDVRDQNLIDPYEGKLAFLVNEARGQSALDYMNKLKLINKHPEHNLLHEQDSSERNLSSCEMTDFSTLGNKHIESDSLKHLSTKDNLEQSENTPQKKVDLSNDSMHKLESEVRQVELEPDVRQLQPEVRQLQPEVRQVESGVRQVESGIRQVESGVRQLEPEVGQLESEVHEEVLETLYRDDEELTQQLAQQPRDLLNLDYIYKFIKDGAQIEFIKAENNRLSQKYQLMKELNDKLQNMYTELLLYGPITSNKLGLAKRYYQLTNQMAEERVKLGIFLEDHKDTRGRWNGISDRNYLDRLEQIYSTGNGKSRKLNTKEMLLFLVGLCVNKDPVEKDLELLIKMHFADLDPKEYPIQVNDFKRMKIKFKRPDNKWHIDNGAHMVGKILSRNIIKTLLITSIALTSIIRQEKIPEDENEDIIRNNLLTEYNIRQIQHHMYQLSEKKYQQKLMQRLLDFLSNSVDEIKDENDTNPDVVKLSIEEAAKLLPMVLAKNPKKI